MGQFVVIVWFFQSIVDIEMRGWAFRDGSIDKMWLIDIWLIVTCWFSEEAVGTR